MILYDLMLRLNGLMEEGYSDTEVQVRDMNLQTEVPLVEVEEFENGLFLLIRTADPEHDDTDTEAGHMNA